ncbi:DUF58 domain-containing protein [Microbacterium gorillae]|uniref:DUF58 domain-containing protein n=1 Tax=Microbacterium gorillae TaxID=1231063 RepID=UPI00058FAF88|nr:DUF58 domain-containing protein [Microbacterium gorillae]
MTIDSTGTGTGTGTHTRTRTRTRSTTRRSRPMQAALAVSRAFGRGRRWLRTARDEVSGTITTAGWIAVLVAVVGTLVGWLLGWNEWLAGGLVALALLLLSLPFLFGARAYDVGLSLDADRVVAGGSVPTDVTVRNRGSRIALPGRIDLPVGDGLIEIPVPLLRADHTVHNPVEIPTPQRGIIVVGPATAVRSDPIGLLRRENDWADIHQVFVHPRTTMIPTTSAGLIRDLEGNATRRLVDNDMAFHAIREYAPGDAQRLVHWKSTAKTGRLMVRQYEETRRSRMAIAVSLAESDYAGADEYELAVSAAASLSVQALRDGRDVDVTVGAEIPRVVRGRLRSVRQLGAITPRGLLDEFCAVDSLESTVPLEDVCALQAESGDGLSIAFVVCGSHVGLERLRRAALAYAADTSVVAVICDEMAHPRIRPIGDLTVLTIGVLEDLPSLIARGLSA